MKSSLHPIFINRVGTMMKKNILIITLITLTACVNSNPKFTIKNNSGITLDSVSIATSNSLSPSTTSNLKNEEIFSGEIIFGNNLTGDGNYIIEIFNNDTLVRSKGFGYYTNGASLNASFDVTIFRDSISIVSH